MNQVAAVVGGRLTLSIHRVEFRKENDRTQAFVWLELLDPHAGNIVWRTHGCIPPFGVPVTHAVGEGATDQAAFAAALEAILPPKNRDPLDTPQQR